MPDPLFNTASHTEPRSLLAIMLSSIFEQENCIISYPVIAEVN